MIEWQVIICTTINAPHCLYKKEVWDVTALLTAFSRLDWHEYCAAHLFTYQRTRTHITNRFHMKTEFADGIQGLAWVGTEGVGICAGYGGARTLWYFAPAERTAVPNQPYYLNTGLVTGLNFGIDLLLLSSAVHAMGGG